MIRIIQYSLTMTACGQRLKFISPLSFHYLFIYLFIHLLFFEKGNIIFIVDLTFEEQSQNSEGFLNEPSISAPVYR